jgi:hypothetical protein
MDQHGMIPFGAALQSNVVVLRTGLATVLGLVENALAEEDPSVGGLQTTLENIKAETIQAMKDEKVATELTPGLKIGGFDNKPGIEWGEK